MINRLLRGGLSGFDGIDFYKGTGLLKITAWYFINALFVRAAWNPFMTSKVWLPQSFGAKIGKRLCLKNDVIIKSPWNLVIGDDCWIGEKVWIDNFDKVYIGGKVCFSQSAQACQCMKTLSLLLVL